MKTKRIIVTILCSILVIIIGIIIFQTTLFFYKDEKVTKDMLKTIVHGGGIIIDEDNNYSYSNSLEAIESSYDKGSRFIELDFDFTSDNELVLIHDWSNKYCSNIKDNKPLTKEEFLKCKIYDKFTSISIDELIDFMESHKGLYIVTDIKDNNIEGAKIIAEKADDFKNRFIIQIYNIDEYKPIKSLGFDNIIFTLYKLKLKDKLDTETLKNYAKQYTFIGYTFDAKLLDRDGYLDKMKSINTGLFVHNINYEYGNDYYYNQGINGVYTDYPE